MNTENDTIMFEDNIHFQTATRITIAQAIEAMTVQGVPHIALRPIDGCPTWDEYSTSCPHGVGNAYRIFLSRADWTKLRSAVK